MMTSKRLEQAKAVIFNDLDIEVGVMEQDGSWYKTDWKPISTSRIGVMALMIDSLKVRVFVGEQDTVLYFRYEFSYTHPGGGTNGYELRKEVRP